jgi:hypothetical protein
MATRRPILQIVTLLAAAALAAGGVAATPAAQASIGSPVIADCQAHSKLTARYSAAALQNALNVMPATVKEYSDCYDVIYHQLIAQLDTRSSASALPGGSSGDGGSFLPTAVIVVLAVLIAAAGALGALALRRRSVDGDAS